MRVYGLVQKLPPAERHRRGDQLIRSANSIRHNIAEGSSGSKAQFANHLQHSIASADELQDELQDLADVMLLRVEDTDLIDEPSEIAAMIATYRQKILRSKNSK